MAEKPAQDRTEQPTRERLRKARRKGRFPMSREMPSALILVMLLVVLALTAMGLYKFLVAQIKHGLSLPPGIAGSLGGYTVLWQSRILQSMTAILPFFLVGAFTSVFASLVVSGWSFSPESVSLKFARLNPVNGLKNLFNLSSLVNLLVSLAKLLVLLVIVWDYLRGRIPACLNLRWETPEGVLMGAGRLVFGLVVRTAMGLMVIAAIDWLYRRWDYKRELRMTKQELKEELREHEVSPEVRSRVRIVQMEMARKRMLQEIPEADVVIANPTHVALALKYDAAIMEAPTVTAKGGDLLCEKIKDIARAHNVPIVYRPELARTIYNTTEVGEVIPEALFVAVAEVLAMVYRTRRNRRTARWYNPSS